MFVMQENFEVVKMCMATFEDGLGEEYDGCSIRGDLSARCRKLNISVYQQGLGTINVGEFETRCELLKLALISH